MKYGKQLSDGAGKRVQYLFEAEHAENGNAFVVYQELSGEYAILVEEKAAFCQRFGIYTEEKKQEEEQIKEISESDASSSSTIKKEKETEVQGVNKDLLRFLDAETCKEKIEILLAIQERVDKRILSNIAAALDLTLTDGTLEEDIDAILSYLRARARFEIRH